MVSKVLVQGKKSFIEDVEVKENLDHRLQCKPKPSSSGCCFSLNNCRVVVNVNSKQECDILDGIDLKDFLNFD